MPIQLNEENGGKILVVHVSGKLVKADYEHFVPEFERLVRQHGKLRVLFDMTGFHGWKPARRGRTQVCGRIISPTLSGSRWSGKRNGSKGWRHFASRSRKQRSDTSITPMPLRRGSGWRRHRKPMNELKHDHHPHEDPNGEPDSSWPSSLLETCASGLAHLVLRDFDAGGHGGLFDDR